MAKFKIKLSKNFIITIVSILIVLFAWAGLTKAGYIKNYFGVEVLCSKLYSSIPNDPNDVWKPVIYLYPQKPSKVEVKLNYAGELIADYPDYDYKSNGWNVFAYPDGKIINNADGKEYSYLFWEGKTQDQIKYNLSSGFIVKGSETKIFLQNILAEIGLTPREYNEFIVFWYPKMKDNKYNLITFVGKEYTDTAPLIITPRPDSILRVFMAYIPLEKSIKIKPQEIKPFSRKGFTVIEWGGTEIK